MAYVIKNKVYTSHALMDEIVYGCNIILGQIVIKDEKKANDNETQNSILDSEILLSIADGTIQLSFFPLTKQMFMEQGYSSYIASQYAGDWTTIPEEEQANALEYCSKYFVDHYVEENNYYRMLNGKPDYGTFEYDIYLNYDMYPEKFDLAEAIKFNFDLPLHEYTNVQITTLKTLGIYDELYKYYVTDNDFETAKHYRYLTYLGSRKIDIVKARQAGQWDIIYMPTTDYYISTRFKELYAVNKAIYNRRTNQLAYSVESDYYEEMLIFMILCQTFNDMIVDTPEWYIRRDIIDLRSVQYFLESYGVKFFKDIPIRYQRRIVKGLNKLIRYKSTLKNIHDIIEIFDAEGVVIYKYYLLRKWIGTDYEPEVDPNIHPEPLDPDLIAWNTLLEMDCGNEELSDVVINTGDGNGNDLIPWDDDGTWDMNNGEDDPEIDERDFGYVEDTESPDDEGGGTDEHTGGIDFEDPDDPGTGSGTTIIPSEEEETEDEITDFNILTVDEYGFSAFEYEFNDNEGYPIYEWDFGDEDGDTIKSTEKTEKEIEYYQHYVRKPRDEYGNVYDLEFIKVPVDESYDDYIRNPFYREHYDTIVSVDKYWDGQDAHSLVKNNHKMKDFTIEGTKYLGLEHKIYMDQYLYHRNYYIGLIFNGHVNIDNINISVPQIDPETNFNLRNLLIFLYCCNGILSDSIIKINNPLANISKRTQEKPPFSPYHYYDAGFPWTIDPNPDPIPEEDVWELTDTICEFVDVDEVNPNEIDEFIDFGFESNVYYDDPKLQDWDFSYELIIEDPTYDFNLEDEDIIYDFNLSDGDGLDPREYQDYIDMGYDPTAASDIDFDSDEDYSEYVPSLEPDPDLSPYDFNYLALTEEELEKLYEDNYYSEEMDGYGVADQLEDYHVLIDGGINKFSGNITRSTFYDYIRTDQQQLFINLLGRIYGFNMSVDLEKIEENISFKHSKFGFERGYTLEELGVADFIVQREFDTVEELYNVYDNNTACYKRLRSWFQNSSNRDERRVYDYVFYEMFTTKYDPEFYIMSDGEIAETYDEVLAKYDYTLYSVYQAIRLEQDVEKRMQEVRDIANAVIDTLNYYISGDNLKYVLTFADTASLDSILHYIYEVADFFKSWKVFFLEPKVNYIIGDSGMVDEDGQRLSGASSPEHLVTYGDNIGEFKEKFWSVENRRLRDSFWIKTNYLVQDRKKDAPNYGAEVIDMCSHYYDHDILGDKDYDGGFVEEPEDVEDITVLDGGGVFELSYSPFYQIVGENIGKQHDLLDLDGGGPSTMLHESCITIDGGDVTDDYNTYMPVLLPTDSWKEKFFRVDGGWANVRYITGNTTVTEIDEGYCPTEEDIDPEQYEWDNTELFDCGNEDGIDDEEQDAWNNLEEFDGGDEELDDIIWNTGDGIVQSYTDEDDDGTWNYNLDEDDTEHILIRDFGYENGIDPPDEEADVEEEIDFEMVNHDVYYDQDGSLYAYVDFNEEAPVDSYGEDTGDGHGGNKFWDSKGNLIELWDFEVFAPPELDYSTIPYSRNRINIHLKVADYDNEWNAIEVRDEGVIVDMNKYVSYSDLEHTITDSQQYKENTTTTLDDLRRTLIATASIEKAEEMIRFVYEDLFADAKDVIKKLNDPNYLSNLLREAQNTVDGMHTWFDNKNPYRWIDLDSTSDNPYEDEYDYSDEEILEEEAI